MLFTSVEYAFLFVITFAGYWLFSHRRPVRVFILLASSYLFYASWNEKYLALIFFSSSLDYFLGGRIARSERIATRKLLLALSAVVNLGILCTFKYFNFFAKEFAELLQVFGFNASPFMLNFLLPVGISLYTFQTLSYVIDVYRGRLAESKNYFEYLLFVSFFPQLVAGPIVRASTLLPQIARTPVLDARRGSAALFLICVGIAKKIVIADFLGVHLVDKVFSQPQMYSSLETLAGVYAYAFQIYADFSAYSDIAIGSAALLGFDVPINFDAPYRAGNLREFWRRWHISLSTWLQDYLYFPLGGSRKGNGRTYVNLMITMVLGGLWHGAALTFVAWGTLHGLVLVITRLIQRRRGTDAHGASTESYGPLKKFGATVLTFHIVCAAWVFFRAPNFDAASEVFQGLFSGTYGIGNLDWRVLSVLGLAFATHWFPRDWLGRIETLFHTAPAAVQAAAVVAVIWLVQQLASADVTPFIYFQF